ncbi:MAG: ABC transporter transmembrane domain-containing protein [Lactobacillus gallinarum]|uniref:ABC transporter transmembrane domain-containing protein n=1 Tax=Lactobacillus gallinarum TaxID=52242 RepID=UPI003807A34D
MNLKELFKTNGSRASLIIFLYILYAITGSLGEYLFKYGLNSITTGNLNRFIYWELVQFIMSILTALLLPIATIAFTRQVQDYLHKIRQDILHHYYNQDNDEKVSSMQNRLTANLKLLADNYATPWVAILSGVLEIIISIILLASMNWILILVTAIFAVITLSMPKIMEKKASSAMDKANKKNDKLLNTIEHWLGGLQELRRYSAYSRLIKQLNRASNDYVETSKKAFKYRSISYLFNGFGNAIAQVGMSFIAGILFLLHIISFGDFVVAGSFAFTIFSAIWNITQAITQVKSTNALRTQIADLRKSIPDKNENKTLAFGIKVSNLSVKYDQGETISYPDFTIKKGQKVLLTGDSGTGKSTLFKVLLGKLKPKTGSVTFLDRNGEAIMNEFKQIHQQANKAAAIDVLHAFYAKWHKSYNHVIRNLKDIEPDLLVFYNYPKQIRASIYSTNMIESFNNVIKRKAKPKAEFQTEQSLDTFIDIQAMSYNDRYFNRIHKGFGQVQDTLESYFD